MTALLRFVIARWLPPTVDRESVLATAMAAANNRRRRTAVEIASVVALGFRVRSREATGDDPWRMTFQGAVGGLVAAGLMFVGDFVGTPDVAIRLVAVAVPATLLAAGWFDPRLAIAAMTIWASRLVVLDHAAFADDLRRLGNDLTPSALLVRWTAMAAGVIIAAVVSQKAMRQSMRL